MYDVGIPFIAVTYDNFELMIKAIGQFGPRLKSTGFHQVRSLYSKKKLHSRTRERIEQSMCALYRVMIEGTSEMTLLNI